MNRRPASDPIYKYFYNGRRSEIIYNFQFFPSDFDLTTFGLKPYYLICIFCHSSVIFHTKIICSGNRKNREPHCYIFWDSRHLRRFFFPFLTFHKNTVLVICITLCFFAGIYAWQFSYLFLKFVICLCVKILL